MGTSSTRKELKRLAGANLDLGDMINRPALESHGDRAASIVAVVDLQDSLKKAILTKMVSLTKTEKDELFSGFGPLASFSSQIKMAYALGVIGKKTRKDLDTIRLIRNVFAHAQKPVSFRTHVITAGCKLLTLPSRANPKDIKPWPPTDPKEMFLRTAGMISVALMALELDFLGFDYPLD